MKQLGISDKAIKLMETVSILAYEVPKELLEEAVTAEELKLWIEEENGNTDNRPE